MPSGGAHPVNPLPAFAQWLERRPEASASSGNSRLLLLVQDFPPRTSIGAARWEGFAPFLERAGWEMDVVMEDPRDVRTPDWDRLGRLPSGLRVATCRRRLPEWYQTMRWLRGAERMTPELRRATGDDAVVSERIGLRSALGHVMNHVVRASESRTLRHQLAETASAIVDARHHVVVSSGPGHYVHVAAAAVSRKHGLPHIVDLRDPWARVGAKTTLDLFLADDGMRSHETDTLQRAALIIANTHAAADVLGRRFPQLRDRIRCVSNGSDVQPVLAADVAPTVFQIVHAGTLYLDRDPRPFLRAVARVRNELQLDASQLRVVFMGPPARIGGQSLVELARDAGIGDLFEDRPPGTRVEAWQLMRDSVMAVAFQGATSTQIPAKVFDYVSFPLWLLALVGSDSATADLLAGSDAFVFDINDEEQTAAAIAECYTQFRAGQLPQPVGYDGRFSREKQADRLLAELEQLKRT